MCVFCFLSQDGSIVVGFWSCCFFKFINFVFILGFFYFLIKIVYFYYYYYFIFIFLGRRVVCVCKLVCVVCVCVYYLCVVVLWVAFSVLEKEVFFYIYLIKIVKILFSKEIN